MDWLIWSGAAISALGLFGLIWCIWIVAKARRANLTEDEMRARIQKVLPLNLSALLLSVIGLMMVVVGILLG